MFSSSEIRNYLELSLEQAEKALELKNYPIGSVFVDRSGRVLAVTMNELTTSHDVSAHAEIIGIRQLGDAINRYVSGDHYLFTSLEPCFGCSFFLARTNVRQIYSALKDPHKGGTSDLKKQEQFKGFFENIDLVNEPFTDLKERSRSLLERYFLNIGNIEAAKFYGYRE